MYFWSQAQYVDLPKGMHASANCSVATTLTFNVNFPAPSVMLTVIYDPSQGELASLFSRA